MGIKSRRKTNKKPPKYKVRLDGGIATVLDSELAENQLAVGTQNIWFNGKRIASRPGLARIFATSLGAGKINGVFDYVKRDGTTITLVAWNTGLYTQAGANSPVLLYSPIANARVSFLTINNECFICDGTNVLVYDGTTVVDIVTKAYVPILLWNKKPDGTGGNTKEQFNQFSNTWYEQFTSQGSATDYNITGADTITSIDEVKVNGSVKVAGTDYSTDTANRKVVFIAGHVPADATGTVTNNVQIKVTKSGAKDPNIIKQCTRFDLYNGFIVAIGNPNYPDSMFWNGMVISDPSKSPYYWPDDHKHVFDSGVGGKCTRTIPHNTSLIVFKERATYRVDPSTLPGFDFDYHIVNYSVGCDMPDSVQLIDNFVVFANSYKGVCILRSTMIPDERNIDVISTNINGSVVQSGLLNEQKGDLLLASSVDDGQRYWLCVKDKAWVWDYTLAPYKNDSEKLAWWPMTNVNASCWIVRDTTVIFGDRTSGYLNKLTPGVYNDYGTAISKIAKPKRLNFGFPEYEKDISTMWLALQGGTNSTVNVTTYSDSDTNVNPAAIDTFGADYANWDYDNATYDADSNNQTVVLYPNASGTIEFQVELSNNVINQDLPVIGLSMDLRLTREVM